MISPEHLNKTKELLQEISNYTGSEAYQHLLIIKSDYYYFEVNCIHIKRAEIMDNVLILILDNNRRAEFLLCDSFQIENINEVHGNE